MTNNTLQSFRQTGTGGGCAIHPGDGNIRHLPPQGDVTDGNYYDSRGVFRYIYRWHSWRFESFWNLPEALDFHFIHLLFIDCESDVLLMRPESHIFHVVISGKPGRMEESYACLFIHSVNIYSQSFIDSRARQWWIRNEGHFSFEIAIICKQEWLLCVFPGYMNPGWDGTALTNQHTFFSLSSHLKCETSVGKGPAFITGRPIMFVMSTTDPPISYFLLWRLLLRGPLSCDGSLPLWPRLGCSPQGPLFWRVSPIPLCRVPWWERRSTFSDALRAGATSSSWQQWITVLS